MPVLNLEQLLILGYNKNNFHSGRASGKAGCCCSTSQLNQLITSWLDPSEMSDDQRSLDEFRSRIAIPNANNNFHCYQYYKKWNVAGKFNAFGRLCATRRKIALNVICLEVVEFSFHKWQWQGTAMTKVLTATTNRKTFFLVMTDEIYQCSISHWHSYQ